MSLLALVTVTLDGRENVSAYSVVGKEHYCTGGIHVTVPYKMRARIPIKERLNRPTTTHLVPQFSCQSTHRLEPSGEHWWPPCLAKTTSSMPPKRKTTTPTRPRHNTRRAYATPLDLANQPGNEQPQPDVAKAKALDLSWPNLQQSSHRSNNCR